jgi:hypothetical protein
MLCRLGAWQAERRDESASTVEAKYFLRAIASLRSAVDEAAAGPATPSPAGPAAPPMREYAASALCQAQFQLALFAEGRCRVLEERLRSDEARRESRLWDDNKRIFDSCSAEIEEMRAKYTKESRVRAKNNPGEAPQVVLTPEDALRRKDLDEQRRVAKAFLESASSVQEARHSRCLLIHPSLVAARVVLLPVHPSPVSRTAAPPQRCCCQ